jgi:hypothetical protein
VGFASEHAHVKLEDSSKNEHRAATKAATGQKHGFASDSGKCRLAFTRFRPLDQPDNGPFRDVHHEQCEARHRRTQDLRASSLVFPRDQPVEKKRLTHPFESLRLNPRSSMRPIGLMKARSPTTSEVANVTTSSCRMSALNITALPCMSTRIW